VVGDDNICEPGPAWDSSMAAEIWEAGKWIPTGSLNSARDDMTAQPLANGRALVVGGTNVDFISFSSTKIWDPKGGTWGDAGLLATARSFPASALLADGRVIVAGGEYHKDPVDTVLATSEVFDPATGKWVKTGALKVARWDAMAATLADGRVLVAGGHTAADAVADTEIWDPATGSWTAIGPTPIWGGSVLVPLGDGGALLAGAEIAGGKATDAAYRLDPKTNKWAATGKMATKAFDRAAAVLANGQVLVAGGLTAHLTKAIAAAELYDPATGTWTATVPLPSAREQSKAILLPDGSVLVAGGDAGYFPPASTPWCPKTLTDTVRYIPAVP
jgi:N-acetylneuraminic acid mutarotase